MVNWTVTATTLYCDAVNDEVTVMVYKDWSAQCTGCKKYGKNSVGNAITVKCEGLNCPRVIKYRDKLIAEEKANKPGIADK